MVGRLSRELWAYLKVIREFLFKRMYRAPAVVEMRVVVTKMINNLFPLFMENTDELPKQWRKDVSEAQNDSDLARIVADYISGRTDRVAIQEHARLTGSDIIERTRVTNGS